MSDRIVLLNGGRIEQMGDPDSLYFHPRSVFAADFLGDSNMLEARALEGAGEGADMSLEVTGGRRLLARPHIRPQAGQSLRAMVRPENMSVLREGEPPAGHNLLEGTLIDSILLGGVVKHYVRLDENVTLVAQELNRAERSGLRRGDQVRLVVRPQDILVLPAEGRLADA